jgi:hypothetical protein
LAGGRERGFDRRPDRTGAKNKHYIGGLNLGIALAHVVSVILTVEGYVCARQSRLRIPKTA